MNKNRGKNRIWLTAAVFVIAAVITAVTIFIFPYIQKLCDPASRRDFQNWASAFGPAAFFAVLGLQILQIVIAVLPGEPIEILCGALFGTWGGLFVCLLGSVIASAFVFCISRKLGMPLFNKLFGEKMKRFRFLNDSSQIESVTFFLFFIPGTPKDPLTYLAGVSPIRLSRFLLISTIARIPSIVTSTFVGANVQNGNFAQSAVMFLVTAAVGIICIRFKENLLQFCKALGKKKAQ